MLNTLIVNFRVAGELAAAERIDSGHINDTYRIEMRAGDERTLFVLQRINDNVFKDPPALMENMARVTAHLREKFAERGRDDIERRVLQIIETRGGAPYWHDRATGYWRLLRFISGSHTVEDRPTPAEIYQAARAFGEFLVLLMDLPTEGLVETIPNFHHGPLRYAAFQEAVEADRAGRAEEVAAEIDAIVAHERLLAEPQRLIETGALPLRAAHNDTKSSNVLLDDSTSEGLCVIDLDTVMPGLALYDFGDLVRTTASGMAEDVPDAAEVRVAPERLEAAARGFLAGASGELELREVESLRLGPAYMTLVMATRFLTDYLNGDVYYKVSRPGHNLDRCRTQLALLRSLQGHEAELAGWLRG